MDKAPSTQAMIRRVSRSLFRSTPTMADRTSADLSRITRQDKTKVTVTEAVSSSREHLLGGAEPMNCGSLTQRRRARLYTGSRTPLNTCATRMMLVRGRFIMIDTMPNITMLKAILQYALRGSLPGAAADPFSMSLHGGITKASVANVTPMAPVSMELKAAATKPKAKAKVPGAPK
eukprot:Skav235017  [mRNA]  locus=scaffold276:283600:293691:- [translate_table: standard]